MSVSVTTRKVPIHEIEAEIARRKQQSHTSVLFASYQGEVYMGVTNPLSTPLSMTLEDGYTDGPIVIIDDDD